ncbi:SGNH/GDSL hydrolase family protein [Nocardia mexicana]|uniref:GDSL-like lipase/acylhydrolase family protein n=1 Tax=Nocardia mexicana TaxID=279262 RepID=A0A370H497_9NOCA|nr:SGNH/GDSL hydrolase family protein [Nocardia mexicana]RDI50993.1 GDSL-like lipase/acylhydrolase family protein [Nocardia mexicana]
MLEHSESAAGLDRWRGRGYVALGSSYASGPGIAPRVRQAPRLAGRSHNNYPHRVATAAGLRLTDVTSSGATCEHILRERQFGQPPQLEAVGADADLVTVTIGGNDIGLTPYLIARRMPRPMRLLPKFAELGDETAVNHRLHTVERRITEVLEGIGERAPHARVLVVNYLSVLGPATPDDSPVDRNYRHFAEALAAHTAAAAARAGADLVDVRSPSLDHPAGSPGAWTVDFYIPVPGRSYPGAPCHPTAAGMAAAADLVLAHLAVAAPRR